MGELAMGLVIMVVWLLAIAIVVGYPALVTIASARLLYRVMRDEGTSVAAALGLSIVAAGAIPVVWFLAPGIGYIGSIPALIAILQIERGRKRRQPALPRATVMSCPAPR